MRPYLWTHSISLYHMFASLFSRGSVVVETVGVTTNRKTSDSNPQCRLYSYWCWLTVSGDRGIQAKRLKSILFEVTTTFCMSSYTHTPTWTSLWHYHMTYKYQSIHTNNYYHYSQSQICIMIVNIYHLPCKHTSSTFQISITYYREKFSFMYLQTWFFCSFSFVGHRVVVVI